jgi:hypothetical protein
MMSKETLDQYVRIVDVLEKAAKEVDAPDDFIRDVPVMVAMFYNHEAARELMN